MSMNFLGGHDMAALFSLVVDAATPVFLVLSPIFSYSDQIISIHKTKNLGGFSMDIPLIMLVASILKVFYWFGVHYPYSLLLQAIATFLVQATLLKVALDNRSPIGARGGVEHMPFSSQSSISNFARPYSFWQWKNTKPYWQTLLYLILGLLAIHVLLPPISHSVLYNFLLGSIGLGVEALLPIPQILMNRRNRSCHGFRISVLGAWLIGDIFKMSYLFFSKEPVPLAFQLCGTFQFVCDCYLGLQYAQFGDGELHTRESIELQSPELWRGL